MPIAFLLDEHLRGPLWHAILRHNLLEGYPLDVVRVGDPPELALGSTDAQILVWAELHSRLLVTEDRHTMPVHLLGHCAAGHHSPGILMLRGGHSVRDLIEALVLVAHAGDPEAFVNVITYIP